MQYKQKSKLFAFVTAAVVCVLLCGTAFTVAYTKTAAINRNTDGANAPIRISNKTLGPQGRISFEPRALLPGATYYAQLFWGGDGQLSLILASPNGTETEYPLENGKETSFQADSNGGYMVAVSNGGSEKAENIKGSIYYGETVVYDNVELGSREGKYIRIKSIRSNHTAKKIVSCSRAMLAYDKEGNPLKLDWWAMDDEINNEFMGQHSGLNSEILPGQQEGQKKGWRLNAEAGDSVHQAAYILFCDTEIAFGDGTVWVNPDFEKWRAGYEGKKIPVDVLESYYPYVQIIEENSLT